MGRVGRKRNIYAKRDKNGKNRDLKKPEDPKAVALKPRIRDFGWADADNALCGHCLGQLHLHGYITAAQLRAGERFGALLRHHASIMGFALGTPRPAVLELVGASVGQACDVEPDEQVVLAVRSQVADCFSVLMEAGRLGRKSIPMVNLTRDAAFDLLKIGDLEASHIMLIASGLNAVGSVLK